MQKCECFGGNITIFPGMKKNSNAKITEKKRGKRSEILLTGHRKVQPLAREDHSKDFE